MHFQDGTSHKYEIPTLKVQVYSLEELSDKHLMILVPFVPLRYRWNSAGKDDVATFFKEIIVLLEKEVSDGYLTEAKMKIIMELLSKSMIRVFYKDEKLIEEALDALMVENDIRKEVTKAVEAKREADV